jgi:hypothetical protein
MIKLFRKKRLKMLTQNPPAGRASKFANYVVYAAGEILLVIVGILIALAINEHSNDQKKLELRNSDIVQLNDEANRNLKKLTVLNDEASTMLKELDSVFKMLLNKDYDNPKLSSKSFFLIVSKKYYPEMITYENLKFSGDLKLFDDLDLRNLISETYETFNPIKKLESSEQQTIEAYYENFLMPKVQFRSMGTSSETYGRDIYFENMVLTRLTTIAQNQESYTNAMASLEKLIDTFSEIPNKY